MCDCPVALCDCLDELQRGADWEEDEDDDKKRVGKKGTNSKKKAVKNGREKAKGTEATPGEGDIFSRLFSSVWIIGGGLALMCIAGYLGKKYLTSSNLCRCLKTNTDKCFNYMIQTACQETKQRKKLEGANEKPNFKIFIGPKRREEDECAAEVPDADEVSECAEPFRQCSNTVLQNYDYSLECEE